MRKKIEKIVPPQPKKSIGLWIYNCDECNKQIKKCYRCKICKKDLCHPCLHFEDTWSDYPDHYCKGCYDLIYIKYKNNFAKIEANYENTLDALWEKLEKEASKKLTKLKK